MGWREILNTPDKRDKSPKSSSNDPFCTFSSFCPEVREIKEDDEPTGTIAVPDYFGELEREYFLNLVDFMESPKHRMDRKKAEREAKAIVDQYRQRKQERVNIEQKEN